MMKHFKNVRSFRNPFVLLCIVFLLTSVCLTLKAYAESGLIAQWTFDEGLGNRANDSSGNGNHGMLTNMDPATAWTRGKIGGALVFDGSDDFVDVGESQWNYSMADHTFTAWIYVKGDGSGNGTPVGGVILSKGSGNLTGFQIGIRNNDKKLYAQTNGAETVSNESITNDKWHHVAIVFHTSTVSIYINGVLSGSSSFIDYNNNDYNLHIGNYQVSAPKDNRILEKNSFNGLIDDVRIYNRALSQEGIMSIYRKGQPYNFVVIFTDDQRWDTLWAMPIVQQELVARGVTFTNAYVTTPQCCPDRASLHSGGFYPHHTGVLNNDLPNGGATKFKDTNTLATSLQKSGYKTALLGKYMNGYHKLTPYPYVPPGWTQWIKAAGSYEYNAMIGSSGSSSSVGKVEIKNKYLTYFLQDKALDFLDRAGDKPFFLFFSTYAPHTPAVPAQRDNELFKDYTYRDRAYGEQDLSDKPFIVQQLSQEFDSSKADILHKNQLRSLQAVDRAVGAIIQKIDDIGKLDDTVILYTSDNGLLWGEHGLTKKAWPYEESIRVPFIIVMPGIVPRTDPHLVVANLDIGATIFELTGINRNTDGLSLVPLLKNPTIKWRKHILIQALKDNMIWAGLRTQQETQEWKYVEYATGEQELYDLVQDPYEEESLHTYPQYKKLIKQLSRRLENLKGLSMTFTEIPSATVKKYYYFQLTASGGIQPYTWSIVNGKLPGGLLLDSAKGIISGIPLEAQEQIVSIQVKDSKIVWPSGKPQSFVQEFFMKVR